MPWIYRMLLLISPWILLVYLYIGFRLNSSISTLLPRSKKWTFYFIITLTLFMNSYPLIIFTYHLFGLVPQFLTRNTTLNWSDYLIVFPYWWGLIVVIETLPYLLTLDLIYLTLKFVKSFHHLNFRKWLAYSRLVIVLFIAIYVGFKIYYDTYRIQRSEHNISFSELPESLQGFNINLLADIQIDRFTQEKKINGLLPVVNQRNPDLLFFAGDLVTNGEDYIKQGLDLLCGMKANFGRIACMGDHDFWSNPRAISNGLLNCGWNFMENSHDIINYKGYKILVTGITNIYSRKYTTAELYQLLEKKPEADFNILLVHQPSPEIIYSASDNGYQLLLAGHTHGGQIRFHPFGFELTPSMFETPYYSGIYQYHNLTIVVTNGIGLTFAPIRYHAPAEATVINLYHKD